MCFCTIIASGFVCWIHIVLFLMKAAPVYLCFCWQMINDLKPELCVDQGPMPGNTPILYGCHFYLTQVCLDIQCLQTGGDFVFVGNCCSLI